MGFLLLTLMLVVLFAVIAVWRGPWKDLRLVAGTSLIIVWVSPFFTPATAHQQSDLDKMQFGGPIRFLEQVTSLTPPDTAFPIRINRLLDPQEHPTHIIWWRFWLSVLLVAGLIWVLWRGVTSSISLPVWRAY